MKQFIEFSTKLPEQIEFSVHTNDKLINGDIYIDQANHMLLFVGPDASFHKDLQNFVTQMRETGTNHHGNNFSVLIKDIHKFSNPQRGGATTSECIAAALALGAVGVGVGAAIGAVGLGIGAAPGAVLGGLSAFAVAFMACGGAPSNGGTVKNKRTTWIKTFDKIKFDRARPKTVYVNANGDKRIRKLFKNKNGNSFKYVKF